MRVMDDILLLHGGEIEAYARKNRLVNMMNDDDDDLVPIRAKKEQI